MIVLSNKIAKSGEGYYYFCPGCNELHYLKGWTFNEDFEHPTFSPSVVVHVTKDETCHSFVKNGNIEFLLDSTHNLKGQTVPVPNLPDWILDK